MATSPRCTIAKMSSRRAPPASVIGCVRLGGAAPAGARLGDRAGGLLVGCDAQLVAREGDVVEAEHLDRHRRTGVGDLLAVLVEQRPHLAPAAAGDDGVADVEDAALDERDDDRAAARDRGWPRARTRPAGAFGFAMSGGSSTSETSRIASSSSSTPVPSVPDTSRTSVSPPHSSGTSSCSTSCWRRALRVGVALVDLGDRDDDRHLGRLGVADRLDGLRHDAVVGGDDEHRDVGGLRAAGAHGGERLVAGGVDERDLPVVLARPGMRRCAG